MLLAAALLLGAFDYDAYCLLVSGYCLLFMCLCLLSLRSFCGKASIHSTKSGSAIGTQPTFRQN
jgi:hypothetical protein